MVARRRDSDPSGAPYGRPDWVGSGRPRGRKRNETEGVTNSHSKLGRCPIWAVREEGNEVTQPFHTPVLTDR